ncbi:heavy-metal-associated domain-containing protein [Eggerthellaceae bacterium zg-1084]|uniref:cation transporter n=1 Tax=Berryella wangjianweii TaxID=2734634 RepID=UPI0015574296|nr:heavy metal-associated domain-containing protein [Berryella wangjianweii]NPD31662.1 heavy-metal-associated domain-containing protein [Berryella wangjianweii]NPD32843.1 heavy-metal-associated domain-containing protein [Eggerthellaceae bacterium zg-997]
MKRAYRLDGNLCAHCGNKIEDAVRNVEGVIDARVNFLTMRFTLEADDDLFPQALEESKRLFDVIEPGCTIRG